MSDFENAVNAAVPDNNYIKPLMIAAGALLLGHLFGGKKDEAPAAAPVEPQAVQPPQQGGFLGGGGIAGGLGGMLSGLANSPLGGIVAGAAAGTAVSAGLDGLLNQFRGAGHAETVNSWVGDGANRPISPDQISNVLGQGKIAEIAAQAGVSPEQLSQLLAQALPTLVDKLTPGGRLPPS
ncbi:Uncharacterized conserved protein YidB, DUF937 family [Rhodoblastus acidophilus]|uniref:Uncharacterized conserved protein YidB, DUF937 family n=1 Tax=Rhodoblastus acidophilus TaxID=1074 RepID=A0A212S8C0_RHOAC|nr:YidB family protein [Rhodoblastus acidophilus]MCW2318285.1 uncharacterized protein YidB (DUF937 family) [Rhodoblastus acidophilus]PPQ37045.1 DUF937 domain-containing protein [Rhodoblastus acidophilus]RAI20352.1 DUF937 domain-containing protein [Rhodoblastus acidophilus]SNB81423.1 Uncharacterized conserved protein YidB, DUF937 family [Rhodoblastus acidophilus]